MGIGVASFPSDAINYTSTHWGLVSEWSLPIPIYAEANDRWKKKWYLERPIRHWVWRRIVPSRTLQLMRKTILGRKKAGVRPWYDWQMGLDSSLFLPGCKPVGWQKGSRRIMIGFKSFSARLQTVGLTEGIAENIFYRILTLPETRFSSDRFSFSWNLFFVSFCELWLS